MSALSREHLQASITSRTDEVLGARQVCIKLRKPAGKPSGAHERIKECIGRLRERARLLEDISLYVVHTDSHASLLKILADFQSALNREKARQGLFVFGDLIEMAVVALRRIPALRAYQHRQCRALLIDEFQDNNLLQKNLIYLLAGGEPVSTPDAPAESSAEIHNPNTVDTRKSANLPVTFPDKATLFVVGDDKQSIYGFRGADRTVFNSMRIDFQKAGADFVELDHNYRTHSTLLKIVNTLTGTDAKAFWDIPAAETGTVLPPFFSLWQVDTESVKLYSDNNFDDDDEPLSADECEAFHIIDHIRQLVTSQRSILFDKGELRPAGYDDFAILFRTSKRIANFERYLRFAGIPYTSMDSESPAGTALFYDFYHLLQLAVTPYDRYSYAAVLRSPWAGCGDDTIELVLNTEGAPFAQFQGRPDATPPPGVPAHEFQRLCRAADTYRQITAKLTTASVMEILDYMWFASGYRYLLLQRRKNHHFLESYRLLQKLALASTRIHLFVDGLCRLLYDTRRNTSEAPQYSLADGADGGGQGVQLLTIHRAKGLEFPVVIIADATAITYSDRENVVWEGGQNYSFAYPDKNIFFEISKAQRREESIAELHRLLYVALTRAKSMLIISTAGDEKRRDRANTLWSILTEKIYTQELGGSTGEESVTAKVLPPVLRKDARFSDNHAPAPGGVTDRQAKAILQDLSNRPVITCTPTRYEIAVTALNAYYYNAAQSTDSTSPAEPSAPALPQLPCDTLLHQRGLNSQFGTLCHAFFCEAVTENISQDAAPGFVDSNGRRLLHGLIENITTEETDILLESLTIVAKKFYQCTDAHALIGAAEHRNIERPFLLNLSDVPAQRPPQSFLVSGIIDLCLIGTSPAPAPAGAHAYIIDYKTDTLRRPEEYYLQLACYQRAVAKMYSLPVTVMLYYARSGELLPIELPEKTERALSDWTFLQDAFTGGAKRERAPGNKETPGAAPGVAPATR